MRLTPPTRYTFFSSLVLGLAALAIYFLNAFGIVGGMFHFAFWVAIAAWVLMTVNRLPNLTLDRRPILAPLSDGLVRVCV
jgi:hypothetical protein